MTPKLCLMFSCGSLTLFRCRCWVEPLRGVMIGSSLCPDFQLISDACFNKMWEISAASSTAVVLPTYCLAPYFWQIASFQPRAKGEPHFFTLLLVPYLVTAGKKKSNRGIHNSTSDLDYIAIFIRRWGKRAQQKSSLENSLRQSSWPDRTLGCQRQVGNEVLTEKIWRAEGWGAAEAARVSAVKGMIFFVSPYIPTVALVRLAALAVEGLTSSS